MNTQGTLSTRNARRYLAALGLVYASTAAYAGVEWQVSVSTAAPVLVSSHPQSVTPAAIPVTPVTPVPVAKTPSIEHMQAQQQARIQWGAQVGLITAREHAHLQHTQHAIEQQRRWAYADGWLTYDEQVSLINALNNASQEIEHQLANWQRVQNSYYPMPPVLTYWSSTGYGHQGHHSYHGQHGHGAHHGHRDQGQGHGQGGHHSKPQEQPRDSRIKVVLPTPPLPPAPHQLLRQLRERF